MMKETKNLNLSGIDDFKEHFFIEEEKEITIHSSTRIAANIQPESNTGLVTSFSHKPFLEESNGPPRQK